MEFKEFIEKLNSDDKSTFEKKTKTTIVIAAKKTMEEVLELIDANVYGVKMKAPIAEEMLKDIETKMAA